MDQLFLSDKEVATVLRIHPVTVCRIMNGISTRYKHEDLLIQAEPLIVGGMRRWSIVKLAKATGISEEEIRKAVS